ncbi:MAG: glycosyltransferase family 4 protein, partial [Micrococcales bacterium]|nr:glycosyltransferase family 4 protein [Micrococcales bacterium]
MRIGIVCPYSFDVAGGVQFHVRDLAECLLTRGHQVSVLAPADEDTPLPAYVVGCGRAIPIRYNGSVARLAFGPLVAARVNRWLDEGNFDVVHIHEPIAPSVSILALWVATVPIVATFHSSLERSRAMQAAYPMVRSSLEKIHARIAVSQTARQTVITHGGGDAVVIPNGVFVDRLAAGRGRPRWRGLVADGAPTLAFLGRIDEPRKGLPVLLAALPRVLAAHPGTRLYIAGYGDLEAARARLDPDLTRACEFLGPISEEDKADLLASVDIFVAPHTGGESFGIVLVEAMAAGAPVLASDLPAFAAVLDDGRAGLLFPVGDADALGERLVGLLGDPVARARLAREGRWRARRFDWAFVGAEVLAVYETVLEGTTAVEARS